MRLYEILEARSNVPVDDVFAVLFAGKHKTSEISGVPPISFTSKGGVLEDYRISGNTLQDGTPTPEAPVDVVGCGVWDETHQSYKLPLTIGGTEYPIYLGQVPTTRRIKKLVLTGKEMFYKNYNQSTNYLYYAERLAIFPMSISRTPVFCNDLPVKDTPPISEIGINTNNNFRTVYFNFGAGIMDAQTSGNTVEGLKEYLAAQYASGTPVIAWYILGEPETGIVNEPIHKIGDYADTVSFSQAGVVIPTSDGVNTLTVGTTVQPSSVTIRGRIRPTL